MARTYTITVTDDETGAVIFTGQGPTVHVQMGLSSDDSRECRHCSQSIEWREIRDDGERSGFVEKALRDASHAWADSTGLAATYCPRSPEYIHRPR